MLVLIAEGALGIVGAAGPRGAGPRGPIPGVPTPGGPIVGIPGLRPLPIPTAVTRACVSAMLCVGCIPEKKRFLINTSRNQNGFNSEPNK